MDRPRKREKNLCLEIRSYSNRARKSKKKKAKNFKKIKKHYFDIIDIQIGG